MHLDVDMGFRANRLHRGFNDISHKGHIVVEVGVWILVRQGSNVGYEITVPRGDVNGGAALDHAAM